ncbi:PAS domain S-box-containing protein/diguanylate cyclase (GGDEF)-like protein [Aneurinibacillus soli]|uniref:Phytochrome-like protein cph2 n=1 Tax=Aneurinibacillus soli TaxID=1500254 RepID=A0A0U5B0S9_9BACL|nr:diguanylate cyclase [Aneurinibacillus soli]PYE57936.1 PAS domain S-box-containing protein/diguanylate cyclase (GGDEF)-like protein [Aneurinibacillus soli]BAU26879.1 Phytochrome-like protein cph2 [Aneurinibacillus soli]
MFNYIYRLFRLKTIKSRLQFWGIFFVFLIGISSLIPTFFIISRGIKADQMNYLEQTVSLQSTAIENWFNERSSYIRTISNLNEIRNLDKERMKNILTSAVNLQSEFDMLTYINKNGFIEIDSSKSGAKIKNQASINLSDRDYFQEGKKGKEFVSDVIIARATGKPSIIVSCPIIDSQQQFQGVIAGVVEPRTVEKIMERMRFGKTGETYLVNREGVMITESRFIADLIKYGMVSSTARLNLKVHTEIVQKAQTNLSVVLPYSNYRGVESLGAYHWTQNGKWLVIAEVNQAEMLDSLYNSMFIIIMSILCIVAFVLYIVLKVSHHIERPLQFVLNGVRLIQKSNYKYRIDVKEVAPRAIEFQEVCSAFNLMAETVETTIHGLEDSEERYRTLIETSPHTVLVHSKGKIVFMNQEGALLFGANHPEELIGKDVISLVHPDSLLQVKERVASSYENKKQAELLEEKLLRLDGTIIYTETVANPITYNGNPGSLVIVRDITERKKIEKALQDSEEKFRLLAETSGDMITIHNVEGEYLYVSPACHRLLQYEMDNLLGKSAYLLIHPDDLEYVHNAFLTLQHVNYTSSTYRIRQKSGEYVWFETNLATIRTVEGALEKIVAVSRDITERKLLEQQLQEANHRLEMLSWRDGLTGIANRRFFDEKLESEWKRAARGSTPLSLIMIDIDHFKLYNDTYGHQGGDDCLKKVAETLASVPNRSGDIVARYGGEEFAVILPQTNNADALKIAEKLCKAIASLEIPHASSKVADIVTVSAGLATMLPTPFSNPAEVISLADKALYYAKESGRNQVQNFHEAIVS